MSSCLIHSMVASRALVPRVASSSTAFTVFSRDVTLVTITWWVTRGGTMGETGPWMSVEETELGASETSCLWWAERLTFFSVDSLRVLLVLCT